MITNGFHQVVINKYFCPTQTQCWFSPLFISSDRGCRLDEILIEMISRTLPTIDACQEHYRQLLCVLSDLSYIPCGTSVDILSLISFCLKVRVMCQDANSSLFCVYMYIITWSLSPWHHHTKLCVFFCHAFVSHDFCVFRLSRESSVIWFFKFFKLLLLLLNLHPSVSLFTDFLNLKYTPLPFNWSSVGMLGLPF